MLPFKKIFSNMLSSEHQLNVRHNKKRVGEGRGLF